jgi:hypothetical protein
LICFCLPARGRGRGMTKLIGSGRGEGTGSIRRLPWRLRSTRVVAVEKGLAPP